MLKFNQLIKYDSYMWNYVRLAPKFYKDFLMQMAKEFQAALDAGSFRLTTSSRGSARISLPSSKILRAGLTSIRVLRRMVPWGVLSITPRLEAQAWSPPSSSNR